ncbi:MAG: SRPBCC family protein [Actinomycetota bacterium]
MIETATAPVKKRLSLNVPPGRAFEVFTESIGSWWPLLTHSVFGDRAVDCVFEPGVGGRIYERDVEGAEADWGRVLVWDPPHRIVFSWQPNQERVAATEVEVRFDADGTGTAFELVHRGWELLGSEGAEARAGYEKGWDPTLRAYVDALD